MESTIKSTIGSRPNLSAAIFVNGESCTIIDEIDYQTQIIISFKQLPPDLHLKEVRLHGVEKERRHRSIAIIAVLLAVP